MSRTFLLILAVLIFTPHTFAQDGGTTREAQVDKLFAAWDKLESPGCAVLWPTSCPFVIAATATENTPDRSTLCRIEFFRPR